MSPQSLLHSHTFPGMDITHESFSYWFTLPETNATSERGWVSFIVSYLSSTWNDSSKTNGLALWHMCDRVDESDIANAYITKNHAKWSTFATFSSWICSSQPTYICLELEVQRAQVHTCHPQSACHVVCALLCVLFFPPPPTHYGHPHNHTATSRLSVCPTRHPSVCPTMQGLHLSYRK